MSTHTDHQRLLIIDFGSQVTQLIARCVRALHVYCEIHPAKQCDAPFLYRFAPKAVILSGSPNSVTDQNAPDIPQDIFNLNVPILGICYGQQALIHALGGIISQSCNNSANNTKFGAEYGKANICPTAKQSTTPLPLLDGWFTENESEQVWMSHSDSVQKIPHNFHVYAKSDKSPYAVIADRTRRLYGVQFHPEVHHTPKGTLLYQNFIREANFTGDWSMHNYRTETIEHIRSVVGKKHVVCALSGGVDSAVTAVLLQKAIGKQLTCILVDHGLMRADEAETIQTLFKESFDIRLIYRHEHNRFLNALAGVLDPEQKRKIIGRLFIDVFEDVAHELGDVEFLAQGTLYPDVIESPAPQSEQAQGNVSATIKSHHNVGGLPERMRLALLEPLRHLFKDEVRALGRDLGLPSAFIDRHPFPGPGLAIRCLGAITAQDIAIVRAADAVFLDQIHKHGLYNDIWQAFAVLLPVQSVGVMGDARTYERVCALRAVTSVDGMTADYYPFDHAFISETATRIINDVKGINRVVYDTTSKPPGTIEWE